MTGETLGGILSILLAVAIVIGGYLLHKKLEKKRLASLEKQQSKTD